MSCYMCETEGAPLFRDATGKWEHHHGHMGVRDCLNPPPEMKRWSREWPCLCKCNCLDLLTGKCRHCGRQKLCCLRDERKFRRIAPGERAHVAANHVITKRRKVGDEQR